MIKATDAAAKKFKEIAEANGNPEELNLRFEIEPGGWAGPRLGVALDEHIGKGDIVVETNGVKIAYRRTLHELVKNMRVDYVDNIFSKRFRVY